MVVGRTRLGCARPAFLASFRALGSRYSRWPMRGLFMERGPYLRFDPSLERPRPDEAQAEATILASIENTSRASQAKHGHGIRQQHAKGHGFVRGELQVYDDLPRRLRQGLFATPGRYPVIVRYSTAFGDLRSDRIRAPRGFAIKILGLHGRKALADDKSANQDFLLVNHKNYIADAQSLFVRAEADRDRAEDSAISFLRGFGVAARLAQLTLGFDRAAAAAAARLRRRRRRHRRRDLLFRGRAALRRICRAAAGARRSPRQALARRGQPAHDADDALRRRVTAILSRARRRNMR